MNSPIYVSVWNYKSESTYTFGPFHSQESLNAFDTKVWENTSYDYDSITEIIVNPVSKFGTGLEIS